MKRTRPPTRQHVAAYMCMPAQRCISSQLTKRDDDYTPRRGFFFPASALECSRGHISLIHNRTVACFRLVLESLYCMSAKESRLYTASQLPNNERCFKALLRNVY